MLIVFGVISNLQRIDSSSFRSHQESRSPQLWKESLKWEKCGEKRVSLARKFCNVLCLSVWAVC